MHLAPIFRPLDVRLALSDVLRSTPNTQSVKECRSRSVVVLTPSYGFPPQHIPGIRPIYKMQNLTNFQLTDFLETFRILAGAISGSHEKITKIYFINFEGGG